METFDQSDLEAIRIEVMDSFTAEEVSLLNNFEAFFDLVDVQNAYEDEWEKNKERYRPYYQKIWMELVTGEINL